MAGPGGTSRRRALRLRLLLAWFGVLLWGGVSMAVAAARGPAWLLFVTAFVAVGFAADVVVTTLGRRRGGPEDRPGATMDG